MTTIAFDSVWSGQSETRTKKQTTQQWWLLLGEALILGYCTTLFGNVHIALFVYCHTPRSESLVPFEFADCRQKQKQLLVMSTTILRVVSAADFIAIIVSVSTSPHGLQLYEAIFNKIKYAETWSFITLWKKKTLCAQRPRSLARMLQ